MNLIDTNKIGKTLTVNNDCINVTLVTIDIKMIAMYSAKNTTTKGIEEYSVLNPETNSLSPSAKSNGDRLVSAKAIIKKIKALNGIITKGGIKLKKFKDREEKITLDKRKRLKHTS